MEERRGQTVSKGFLYGVFDARGWIESKDILDILDNINYPHQKIFVLEIERYVYLVPFIESENEVFLKTIIPSRKFTKRYLK